VKGGSINQTDIRGTDNGMPTAGKRTLKKKGFDRSCGKSSAAATERASHGKDCLRRPNHEMDSLGGGRRSGTIAGLAG
jgi:hypothetical protein